MDIPLSRAAAYMKRNRSTHAWSGLGSSDLMSRSCPNARTLADHMRQTRSSAQFVDFRQGRNFSNTSPRRSAGEPPSSSESSPGPSRSSTISIRKKEAGFKGRPSSAYSYDGGFFISANNASKDFFVINPEWVSEVETARRLSSKASGHGWKSHPWTGNDFRRSKSAPPAKYRNPITQED